MSESDVEPITAGQAKPGKYLVIEDEVYVVKSMDKGKSGKHGHAKARIKMQNIFTGNVKEVVMPAGNKIMSPKILKKNAQVIEVSDNDAHLMDLEDFSYFDASLPGDAALMAEIQEGGEVEYWMVMGRKVIVRAKS